MSAEASEVAPLAVATLAAAPPRGAAPLAAAAMLLAAAAAAIGFVAGQRAAAERGSSSRSLSSRKRRGCDLPHRPRDGLCECGVRLPKGSTPEAAERHRACVRHRRNMSALEGTTEVVVCEEVGEYRTAAQQLVGPEDRVLEVGCHVGGTTKILAGSTRHLVGLDQQPTLVAEARERLPAIQFEVCDAFDAQRILALSRALAPHRFTKVFVDISGSRDLSTVIRLLDVYRNTLRPDLLVVKSQPLKRLLLKAQLWVEHPWYVESLI
mmetsp:Transcript_12053/g.26776  ORF Transcript_12053/g.26776 Transcript_12053/m.26776 type:complete len:266 (+) Transcript_12053:75-872(+)